MNRLQRMNQWMTPRMPVLILCALVLGLLFPSQIGILCPYVTTMMTVSYTHLAVADAGNG